jgi:Flp pilus assembly pilin Flp
MRVLRRFLKDRRGAIAVEFAIVGPPFLLLLLAIVELALTLFTQTLMDGATRESARLIRTGQVQTGTTTAAQLATFQTLLCQNMSALMSVSTCDNNLIINAQTFSTFQSLAFTPCTKNNGAGGGGTACQFGPFNPKQIVGVQVSYNRKSLIAWVGKYLTVGGSGFTNLVTTVIFMTEPY